LGSIEEAIQFEGSPDLTLSPYARVLATLFDPTTSDDAAPDKDRSPAMEIVGLQKTFSEKVAVNNIDLSVPCGSFFGLVGPDPGSRPSWGHGTEMGVLYANDLPLTSRRSQRSLVNRLVKSWRWKGVNQAEWRFA
jgi:hypothetical protein